MPPAFPRGLSGGGPWHSAAGRRRSPVESCSLCMPVERCVDPAAACEPEHGCFPGHHLKADIWLAGLRRGRCHPGQTELLAGGGCGGTEKQLTAPPQPSGLTKTYRDVPAKVKLLPVLTGVKSHGLPPWANMEDGPWATMDHGQQWEGLQGVVWLFLCQCNQETSV